MIGKRCRQCVEPATFRSGEKFFCTIHYRARQMRDAARRHKKRVPSHAEMMDMIEQAQKAGMICVGCGERMVWLAKEKRSGVVTLQHDRNGTIRLLCLSCNTRHQFFPGDTYYETPSDHKYCHGCELLKPLTEFYPSRKSRNTHKRMSRCKRCSYIATRNYKLAKKAQRRLEANRADV